MNMTHNHLFKTVMELDLEPIKGKLMHVESGEGWDRRRADAVEREYRRFLCLMKLYPDEALAPMADVDTFWHYHILDTMKYARDCAQAFGYFLHHYPYVGLNDDDGQIRIDSGARMRTLYEASFGEAYPGAGSAKDAAYCAGPGVKAIGAGFDTAYCAGPGSKAAMAGLATAYCAGPGAKGMATAYCAGPGARRMQVKAGTMSWTA